MLELDVFDGVRDDGRFVSAYVAALRTLQERGARGALAALGQAPGVV